MGGHTLRRQRLLARATGTTACLSAASEGPTSRLLVPHRKKTGAQQAYVKFITRTGGHPKTLLTDFGGEICSDEFDLFLLAHGVQHVFVPKGEHHANGPAEKGIGDIDRVTKAITGMADKNIPSRFWGIVAEHCVHVAHLCVCVCVCYRFIEDRCVCVCVYMFYRLIEERQVRDTETVVLNAVISPSVDEPTKTIFEATYGQPPDYDAIPPVGCYTVRLLEKQHRKDFRFGLTNQPVWSH